MGVDLHYFAEYRTPQGWALCATESSGSVPERRLIDLGLTDQANGSAGFQEHLLAFHGKPVRPPQHPDWRPEPGHLAWHGQEVFKGEARHRP
jgi:hypothetical protein